MENSPAVCRTDTRAALPVNTGAVNVALGMDRRLLFAMTAAALILQKRRREFWQMRKVPYLSDLCRMSRRCFEEKRDAHRTLDP